jgi:uncharacterized protein CbrC (UPF0167 family)
MWPFKRESSSPKNPKTTFQDLGAPFPLFEAPVVDACAYQPRTTCSICGQFADVCFNLDIGCALMRACPACGAENGLDANDREDQPCRACAAIISFPEVSDTEILTCYSCLRAGRAALTKDTELGMISWEQSYEGLTNGRPGLSNPAFELVATDSDWIRARVPQEFMFELLRTPTYSTIQGDCWQFCCKHPMIFVGQWNRSDFNQRAPNGKGEAFFRQIVQDIVPGLWEDQLHDETGIYVFRCSQCSRLTAHWDLA